MNARNGVVRTPRDDTRSPRSTPRRWIPCPPREISTVTRGSNRCQCARGRSSRAASWRLVRSRRRAPARSSRWNRRTPPVPAVGRRPSRQNRRRRRRRRSSWREKNERGGERQRVRCVKIKRPRRGPGKLGSNPHPKRKTDARDATNGGGRDQRRGENARGTNRTHPPHDANIGDVSMPQHRSLFLPTT
jgi:hypothetical protein